MLSGDEKRVLSLIDSSRTLDDVAVLIEGGEKMSGSEAEQQVARLIRDKLHMIIDSCELEGFPVTSYVRGKGELEVLDPVRTQVTCEVNPCGAAGSGEVLLLDAGRGTRADYQRLGDVSGKAVLVSDTEGLAVSALEARAHGAACVIYHFPPRDDDLISVYGVNTDIPALSVSNDSARELRRLLDEHGEVRIRYETDQHGFESTSYNVVGELTGWRYPREFVYLTAHHDTFFDGANDNLTSVALLLEMARVFSQDRPERTVRFISFGSEESGVAIDKDALYWDQGSTAYSVAHERMLSGVDPGEKPICILNGELTGYTKGTSIDASPELIPAVQEVIVDLLDPIRLSEVSGGWSSSDHLCFHTLGVPAAQLSQHRAPDSEEDQALSPYMSIYHTTRDDLAHVFPEALETSARAWLLLAWRFANGGLPPFSADHLVDSAVRGLSCTEQQEEITERLRDIADGINDAGSRGDRLSRSLGLIRTVNRNLYGCQFWDVHPKFGIASAALDRLGEARRLLEDGGAPAEAARLVEGIPTAAWYRDYGELTTAEAARTQADSPVLSRLSPVWLGLHPLVLALERNAPRDELLTALSEAEAGTRDIAAQWADTFAEDLRSLR